MLAFFIALWHAAEVELRQLRAVLISILSATGLGVFLILAFRPSMGICPWITLAPWAFSVYHLFSFQRLMNVHLTGESLEVLAGLAKALKRPGSVAKEEKSTGMFSNELTDAYLLVIRVIVFAQTVLFLMMPLYVNYTEGGFTLGMVLAMLFMIIAMASVRLASMVFGWLAWATVAVYVVGLTFALFPQLGFYSSGIADRVEVVAPSTAKLSNELFDLQRKQQEEIDNDFVKKVIEWQKAHPREKLPQDYQAAFDRARQFGKLK